MIINLLAMTLCFFLCMNTASYAQKMNNKKLVKIINEVANTVEGQEGYWQIKYFQRDMYIITDINHDRMRIISPIIHLKELDQDYYAKALEANFHTALDIKYATSDSIMWAVFIHPLSALSENQTKDAIKQVYMGALNFGGSYSSSDLVFPGKQKNE